MWGFMISILLSNIVMFCYFFCYGRKVFVLLLFWNYMGRQESKLGRFRELVVLLVCVLKIKRNLEVVIYYD